MIAFKWISRIGCALGLGAMVAFSPVQAGKNDLEFKAVEEKKLLNGTHQFDESKGYIFLHSNARQFGVFIKEPDAQDIAAYEADWTEKFEKAKSKYERRIKTWQKLKDAKSSGAGKKPVEPTEENFSIGPIEIRNTASFGPQFIFSKDKSDKDNPVFSYMIELEPGTYLYHGPLMALPGAPVGGVCYCMGSVQFEVKAGEITDLGNFLTNAPAIDNGGSDTVGPMFLRKTAPDSKQMRWLRNPVKFGLPDSLSAYESVQASFAPSGKMNNVYRAMVSRMGPVEGLFRYDRDQVVDMRDVVEDAVEKVAAESIELIPAPEPVAELNDEAQEAGQ